MWGPLSPPGLGLGRAMWHVGDTSACSQLLCATLQPHLYQLREPFVHTILPTVLYLGYLLFKRELTYFFLSGPFTHPQFALAKTVWWVRGGGIHQYLWNVMHGPLPPLGIMSLSISEMRTIPSPHSSRGHSSFFRGSWEWMKLSHRSPGQASSNWVSCVRLHHPAWL